MYDPAVETAGGGEAIRAWKPAIPGVREVLHARFTDHAYPPHTHDTWTLFIVDDGSIRYDLDRRPRGAAGAMVGLLPPHVVHDGRPGTRDGYRKRVLYLETSLIPERLIGPAIDRSDIRAIGMRAQIAQLHDVLAHHDDAFEAETRVELLAERIRTTLGDAPDVVDRQQGHRIAERLRAHLDAHLFEPITLSAAAGRVEAGATVAARAFSDAYGIAPHRYLIGRRLDAARDRILRGQSLADVAVEVGFVDQAHLTRRFREFLGTTPGQFARSRRRIA